MHVKAKRNNKPDGYGTKWNFSFSFLPFHVAIGSNECYIAAIPLLVHVFANMFDTISQYTEIFHHEDTINYYYYYVLFIDSIDIFIKYHMSEPLTFRIKIKLESW